MKKKRVDDLLVEQNLIENKGEALSYVMAGKVFTTKEIKILTVGEMLPEDTELYIKGIEKKYVSRGGLKLEKALDYFKIDLKNKIALDIGASTGGFTDVALQNGAQRVYALDVGTNQLAWELRNNDKVTVMEQTNFRYSKPEDFTEGRPSFASIDVSFISLSLILPPLKDILKDKGEVVALIKPQFEAKKEEVGPGGIVKDPSVYKSVLEKVLKIAQKEGFEVKGLTISPIKGSEGNIEFLAHFDKNELTTISIDQLIEDILAELTVD